MGRRTMDIASRGARASVITLLSMMSACRGPQAVLDPAGRDAAEIARLFWWMAGVATLVWVAMTVLTLVCARGRRVANAERFAPQLIVGGGVALPVVVLTTLLVAGLPSLPRLVDAREGGHLSIAVSGEQWW
jgi:cytochrome c oxidase subunit II